MINEYHATIHYVSGHRQNLRIRSKSTKYHTTRGPWEHLAEAICTGKKTYTHQNSEGTEYQINLDKVEMVMYHKFTIEDDKN